jgi:uncharacterized Tic20 family protein
MLDAARAMAVQINLHLARHPEREVGSNTPKFARRFPEAPGADPRGPRPSAAPAGTIGAPARRAGPLRWVSSGGSRFEELRPMNLTDELEKLRQLHQSGVLDDEEFALAKAKLLNQSSEAQPWTAAPLQSAGVGPAAQEQQARQWAFLLHLSILAGFVVPVAGLVIPIAIWQLKKDELLGIDAHGKNVVNWIISAIIYAVVCVILAFVIIGIPLLIALGVVAVIFPIVAAIKAKNGEVWKYPLSISFLK